MKNGMSLFLGVSLVVASVFCGSLQAANSYLGVQKGMIHLAYVEYKDSDTVTITAGYGECNGHYWEVTEPIDYDMTGLTTAEDFHYIYIDDANSLYSDPIFTDSTTEPVWSNAKLGWYNGNNRCIGVVWSPAGSATILEYVITSDLKWMAKNTNQYIKLALQNGDPDGQDQFLECSDYSPVNSKAILIAASNADTNDTVFVQVHTSDSQYGKLRSNACSSAYDVTVTAAINGWLELPRGSSRDLYWSGDDNDNNVFSIHIDGFQIER